MKSFLPLLLALGLIIILVISACLWLYPQSEKAVMAGLLTELADDVAAYAHHHEGYLPGSWEKFVDWNHTHNPWRPNRWQVNDLNSIAYLRWKEKLPIAPDSIRQARATPLIHILPRKYQFLEPYFDRRLQDAFTQLQPGP